MEILYHSMVVSMIIRLYCMNRRDTHSKVVNKLNKSSTIVSVTCRIAAFERTQPHEVFRPRGGMMRNFTQPA